MKAIIKKCVRYLRRKNRDKYRYSMYRFRSYYLYKSIVYSVKTIYFGNHPCNKYNKLYNIINTTEETSPGSSSSSSSFPSSPCSLCLYHRCELDILILRNVFVIFRRNIFRRTTNHFLLIYNYTAHGVAHRLRWTVVFFRELTVNL